jgi:hypothetical protein
MNGETMSEDFEYDEAMESDAEAWESADEGLGESDESDESDEGVGESDESDEALGWSAESDESDEGIGESDESDEGLAAESDESDESDEASASFSTNQAAQDRARRRSWARSFRAGLAADQRARNQQGAATRRDLRNQLQRIRVAPPTRVATAGRLDGPGVFRATLPNGRSTPMTLKPAVATTRQLKKLQRVIVTNDQRQARAIAANSRAIAGLAKAETRVTQKLTAQQAKFSSETGKRLVQLEGRITNELSSSKGVFAKQNKHIAKMLRAQERKTLWNCLTIAAAMPTFAAYGNKSDLFSKNNLILTGSLAAWLTADEILDKVLAKGKARSTVTSGLSFLAPVGHVATSYFFLNDKQHERFVAGTATLIAGGPNKVTVPIAKDSKDDFAKLNATVVASIVDDGSNGTNGHTPDVRAIVKDGVIEFTFEPGLGATTGTTPTPLNPGPITVAWMVDTQPPTN